MGSIIIEFNNFFVDLICSSFPSTASQIAPSAPLTPPPATCSALAPVRSEMASISVTISPATGNKRGPCEPGAFNFRAKSFKSA